MKDETFEATYRKLAIRYTGRDLGAPDGTAESALTKAEGRLGLRLPLALRELYRVAGRAKRITVVHNCPYTLDELVVEDGHLVFMDENQGVVSWGFRVAQLAKDDPIVWQRNNTPPVAWFSERKRFTRFLDAMFSWYAEVGVYPPP